MISASFSKAHSFLGSIWNSGYWRFFGPAIIASVAYVDPGNFGTDISGGASYGYLLIWSVVLANVMAMLLQYLSGKLGIATGMSLATIVREKLKTRSKIIPYWLGSETFAVATDLAEFLGVTSAVHLLFGVPLLISCWIAAVDVVIIYALAGKRFRRIELFITVLISTMSLGYVYELLITRPDPYQLAFHAVVPTMATNAQLFIVVGVIGATVMPHALVAHSWLTKNKLTSGDEDEKRRLLKFHTWDTIINMSNASFVNIAIMSMAAAAFYFRGFVNVATIDDAYLTLTPLFGIIASYVFAITLFASGWSSSTMSVMAGQVIFEDLVGFKVNPWVRRIVIRVVNIVPTSIMISLGYDPLFLLVWSQVILSFLIPLPLIPLILFTRNKEIMREFVNRNITTILALVSAIIIIGLNAYLIVTSI
ncbi:MAG TPA: Nramp family divalent metal transporter [Terriglobales bacterium]|nr:Nramp family divalent metal transporter [Terriglobales bacterium]